ncbi:Sodium Bile acid symporter family protein [Legionella steelei]|jgi:ACR3 family arsenite efflux pump ArsB|uniref:Sodium Bile acid symporter family protein n=2 Tax=Legionellaceae TaxID=444 RepID=A0A0W0ZRQ6_9GAMM|nr:bile acid:sodium symporter [Legionella steelei]KTD71720.1 Sodium Bile acid symporter family protein [Legionella steelei]MBN9229612.1 arsenic resistance protein [Legionella sp.]
MNMQSIRELLEAKQIIIYFSTVIVAIIIALLVPATKVFASSVNLALALMLFVTFLQVPLADFKQALVKFRFLMVLFLVNFMVVPLIVVALVQFLPIDPMVRLGVLLVLLTPCIDYVVTFAHIGRADARLLLVATPALLILQMLLLPIYLGLFLEESAAHLVQPGPFVEAFIWIIAIPLVLAALTQAWANRKSMGKRVLIALGLLPVPATALVLFVVITSVVPQLGLEADSVLKVVPIYIAFAIIAPWAGWFIARIFRLDVPSSRSVAFSASTRNSLVVLPLAFAIPGAVPILPAIIVTQTLVELISELFYVRLIPKLMNS